MGPISLVDRPLHLPIFDLRHKVTSRSLTFFSEFYRFSSYLTSNVKGTVSSVCIALPMVCVVPSKITSFKMNVFHNWRPPLSSFHSIQIVNLKVPILLDVLSSNPVHHIFINIYVIIVVQYRALMGSLIQFTLTVHHIQITWLKKYK